MNRILAAFVRNTVFANLLLIMILLAGVLSTVVMIREVMPPFAVESITVRVPYPGAGPEEVEEGVSLKLEDAIEGVQGVKEYRTISAEGMATAIIDVRTGEDVQVVKDRVTDRINAIQTFPDDAENPSISELIIERMTIAISLASTIPERQMKELAADVKDDLMRLPEISGVRTVGARDYEISIEIAEEKLREYGLTFDEVSRVVGSSSINLPGGQVRTENEEISIRTMGRGYTGRDYGDIVLLSRADGTALHVRDIATVRDGFTESAIRTRFNGTPAVTLLVYNNDDEDAIEITGAVRRYVEEKNGELVRMGLGDVLQMETWLNTAVYIEQRIEMLVRNGIIGLTLVFLLLWVFLDLRLAFWVALAIPISLSGGLFLLYLVGGSLNMISLFAMIMVLGIIVDDAIIVGESIYHYRKSGRSPIAAAVEGTSEVAMPVIAAVLTSCVAFTPLLFVEGVMGRIVAVIPTVVICALLVSLLECLTILPAHLNNLPPMNNVAKRGKGPIRSALSRLRRGFNGGMEKAIDHYYRPAMAVILSWRYVTLSSIIAVLLITLGLLQGGLIRFIFFPDIDSSYIIAEVEFPDGTPLDVTEQAAIRMEDALMEAAGGIETRSGRHPIVALQSSVGMKLINPAEAPHMAEILVEFVEAEDRFLHSREIVRLWQEKIGTIPGIVSLNFISEGGGPPGKPIEIWLTGRDLGMLSRASEEVRRELGTYAGVFQIEDDFRPGKRELRASLKPEARALGLTTGDLGRQLRQGFYGDEVLRVQRGRDEVKVWVRYPEAQRASLSDVDAIHVRTADGTEVPLSSVADVAIEEGYTTITRKDGIRRIAVTADVFAEVASASDVLGELAAGLLPDLEDRYPGLSWSMEGDKRDTQESLGSLFLGFPLAILGIYLLIATLFRSYIQPMIILVTVPFGIIGALWGHVFLGYAVTIMSLFGIVALSGVVVNDAIVYIEAVNQRLARGMAFAESLIDGGARRFRAIILTTGTTVGGLTPLIMERSMQAQFLIPMAVTIAFGVAFATILTLVVIPCLLYVLNDLRRALSFLLKGTWPTHEHVEPATRRHADDDHIFGNAQPAPQETDIIY